MNWPFATPPQVVVTDLAHRMAETVRGVWKDATVVADKFHVIQLFSKSLEAARKRTRSRGTHRRGRHEQRLLHTSPDKLKPEEQEELKAWFSRLQKQLSIGASRFRIIFRFGSRMPLTPLPSKAHANG
ncbi:transposase [Brevibacillus agri]|uniref:transposase n=1 Tax=Brevibacillus agri TaxID=51101 RepID=UPI00399CE832